MKTVWVLVVWLSQNYAPFTYGYLTKAECDEGAKTYKQAYCVKLDVPKGKS